MLFTNRDPVPLVQRITVAFFSAGFAVTLWVIREEFGHGTSTGSKAIYFFFPVMIGCWMVVCVVALLALPPFQSKRRK
jgi:hypothetical protein